MSPIHFYEPLHARIYEAAATLIRAGKLASPVTLKTYFDGDEALSEIGGPAYLARLAASATTIINADEYGRTIYELAQRRRLIEIGEEIVNGSYDAPVDVTPRDLIEQAEQELYAIAETGKFGKGFQTFGTALINAVDMAAKAYERDGGLSGISSGLTDIDTKMGGLQASDLIILAARPAMGKTSLATNIAYSVARAYDPAYLADGSVDVKEGGVVAFFSLEMSAETACDQDHIGTGECLLRTDPARQDCRGRVPQDRSGVPGAAEPAAVYRRYGRHQHFAAGCAGAPAEASERPRSCRCRLSATPGRLVAAGIGGPGPGNHRNHDRPQGAGQGA